MRLPAGQGASKQKWATDEMYLWLYSLQEDYAAAKPKHVFVSSRILDFFSTFPNVLPGIDWSDKDTWTLPQITALLSPPQKEIFDLYNTVCPILFLFHHKTDSFEATRRLVEQCFACSPPGQRVAGWYHEDVEDYMRGSQASYASHRLSRAFCWRGPRADRRGLRKLEGV
jgi:hypothetical protein